ncbi:MAG: response regulator [Caldilineaceae bacterium]
MSTTQLTYADYSILIVDDIPVNLAVLVDYLTEVGFNVRIARTGETALERVHYDAPDLILLDVLMPGLTASRPVAASRLIRRRQQFP